MKSYTHEEVASGRYWGFETHHIMVPERQPIGYLCIEQWRLRVVWQSESVGGQSYP